MTDYRLDPPQLDSTPGQPAIRRARRRESSRAHRAFVDYYHLGPGRSLPALLHLYRTQDSPPTRSMATLCMWSSHFGWPGRASRFDDDEQERVEKEFRARRDAIIQNGLALDHERVVQLVAMYQKLSALALTEDALWVKDVKCVRLADGQVERVEVRRFNGELLRIQRGLLNDLASETGGRINRPSLPGQAGNSYQDLYKNITLDVFTRDEREEFLRLQDKLFSGPSRENVLTENDR